MVEYKTVRAYAEAEYEDRRSRFIGAVMPVTTEEQAVRFISERKQLSFGARHNVYGYILRENNIMRYSDDGEPHSTAGMPTIEVLRKSGVVDCCVVTTRYFGGILLGTGGLVRAYTAAAKAAVSAAGIAVMRECFLCRVVCGYADYQSISDIIHDRGGKVTGNDFAESVRISFSVTAGCYDGLCSALNERFCGRITPEIVGNGFAEV